MLAPVKVVNPRVMAEQYPKKDQQRKKYVPRKSKPTTRTPKGKDSAHIDITA